MIVKFAKSASRIIFRHNILNCIDTNTNKIMIDSSTIKEITTRIVNSINPEKIILFGSYAYGEPTVNSDLDICVIENSYKSKMEEKAKLREALKGIRGAKDILIPSLEEYNFYKNEINSVYYEIETKGCVLWEKNS